MGGRCAFRNLSAGETAAPVEAGECGGGKNPPQISCRKDQAGSLGTEEKTLSHYVLASLLQIRPQILVRSPIHYPMKEY